MTEMKKRITRRHYYKESAGCFLRFKVKVGCLKSQAPGTDAQAVNVCKLNTTL